jgi:sialic acid synthase SpsE
MTQIILDAGSGNTCQNNPDIIRRMIDELAAIDTHKHEVIIKWQLFKKAGNNVMLEPARFDFAYEYAKEKGYKTTASVFDIWSLEFLLRFDIPFVKIANNRSLDWLIGEVPRKVPVYVSAGGTEEMEDFVYSNVSALACVSEYPAKIEDYEDRFVFLRDLFGGYISDHIIGLHLFNKFKPLIWEKHYKLPDSTGLDAGPFAITPEELKEIL